MTTLQLRMREELVRRDFSESAIRTYLHAVEAFRQWAGKRLDHLGPDDMRRYLPALSRRGTSDER